jgi:hypothetical protein
MGPSVMPLTGAVLSPGSELCPGNEFKAVTEVDALPMAPGGPGDNAPTGLARSPRSPDVAFVVVRASSFGAPATETPGDPLCTDNEDNANWSTVGAAPVGPGEKVVGTGEVFVLSTRLPIASWRRVFRRIDVAQRLASTPLAAVSGALPVPGAAAPRELCSDNLKSQASPTAATRSTHFLSIATLDARNGISEAPGRSLDTSAPGPEAEGARTIFPCSRFWPRSSDSATEATSSGGGAGSGGPDAAGAPLAISQLRGSERSVTDGMQRAREME